MIGPEGICPRCTAPLDPLSTTCRYCDTPKQEKAPVPIKRRRIDSNMGTHAKLVDVELHGKMNTIQEATNCLIVGRMNTIHKATNCVVDGRMNTIVLAIDTDVHGKMNTVVRQKRTKKQ